MNNPARLPPGPAPTPLAQCSRKYRRSLVDRPPPLRNQKATRGKRSTTALRSAESRNPRSGFFAWAGRHERDRRSVGGDGRFHRVAHGQVLRRTGQGGESGCRAFAPPNYPCCTTAGSAAPFYWAPFQIYANGAFAPSWESVGEHFSTMSSRGENLSPR
jgi:hypothetical protein